MATALNALSRMPQSAYLLISGYLRMASAQLKLSSRFSFDIQILISMFYPPNYQIFALDSDVSCTQLHWRRLEVFSAIADDIDNIHCYNGRFIIKTILKEVYISHSQSAAAGASGFLRLAKSPDTSLRRKDFVNLISGSKFGSHAVMVSHNGVFLGFRSKESYSTTNEPKMSVHLSLSRTFSGIKLKQIQCGSDHTVFVTTKGRVYCCGENKYGQCGILRDEVQWQLAPTVVPFLYDIVMVDCGRKHNLALDVEGRVWVFGFNEQGQLGLGHKYDGRECVDVALMNTYFTKNSIRITAVHCGFDFSMCLDDRGKCHLFGSNETGQIGNGSDLQYSVCTPYLLELSKRVCSASLGSYHLAVLDEDNNIWTFGSNSAKQCSVLSDPDRNIVRPYLLSKREIGIKNGLFVHRVIASHSTTLIIVSNVLFS